MSVFEGSITEYPGVIVDHFTAFNCTRGRAFFLSHCHKDHMTGLNSPPIIDALQRRKASLYCSEVTRSLLLQDPGFTQLAPYLRGLPMDEPVPMSLDPCPDSPSLSFTVTLLPAGHCPGSTMFFYQGSSGCVLYTGDFRLTLEETKRLKSIHCSGRLLEIKSLYLDTTFCHPIATTIPSREVSRGHILKIAESWLSADQRNVLHLQLGMFGYEHIYLALAKKFSTKVHIAPWRMRAYHNLPAVVDCLTTDGETTRIHACNFRKGVRHFLGVPCGCRYSNGQPPRALGLKPSTIWFLSNSGNLTQPYKYLPESNVYRVLHSMHASYSELCEFISYLKPRKIVPCVVPLGDTCLRDVHVRLKGLLPQVEIVTDPPLSTHSTATPSIDDQPQRFTHLDDEYSNDTIDDFASSEDTDTPVLEHSFSTNTSPVKLFSLPCMLTDCTTECYELEEAKQHCMPPSLGSSGSATLGSLEQTPIDLSPENLPLSDFDISFVSDEDNGSKDGEDVANTYSIRCNSPVQYDKADRESIIPEKVENEQFCNIENPLLTLKHDIEQVSTKDRLSPNSDLSYTDWHLTLESSTEENITSLETEDSDKTTDDDNIFSPEPKRPKLSDIYNMPTTHRHRSRSLSVEIVEHRLIDYIDLTQDQSSSGTSSVDEAKPGQVTVEQRSVYCERCSPCSSRQSRSLSPFCLPPTPGRERVDSILERNSIAF